MREIYSKATRVLWLGEDPNNEAKQAFSRIRWIAQYGTIHPSPDSWWKPVVAFYKRDWLSRLWVFQEIAVATAVYVFGGVSKIPWKTVGRASVQIRTQLYRPILHYSMMNVYHEYLFYKWSVINERPNPPESDIGRFLVAAGSTCGGRKLFYTSKGYVGIGPAILQVADKVCCLSGGAMPFVLRRDVRSRQSKRRFALIGVAYVHGIMYEDAVSKCRDGKQEILAFDLI